MVLVADPLALPSTSSAPSMHRVDRWPNGIATSSPPVITERTAALCQRGYGLLWGAIADVGPSWKEKRHRQKKCHTPLLRIQAASWGK
ncbi:hypothetical protein J6590_093496 [Homalodisca vitripennis]|nr:hypothetical protein J6590_093496 [Homalodisca vitripennis]